jgi:mannosyltransferase OCH1-like enzyme
MLVFNQGAEFVPIDKKTGPELIPKVIHQAWLGGDLPYSKKYLYDKTQRMYPNYKMVIWSEKNITR